MSLFTAKPAPNDPEKWIVYDMYEPLPPKAIFIGTMEEAGLVADAKNRPIVAAQVRPTLRAQGITKPDDGREPDHGTP